VLPFLPLLATIVFSFGWQYVESRCSRGAPDDAGGSDGAAPRPDVPILSLPWLGWLVGLLALLAGLTTLAIAVLLLFAERIARWWERRQRAEPDEPLGEAVQEGLDDLASEPDARIAIIKCYRRFERVARVYAPRAPWQTPRSSRKTLRRRSASRWMADACLDWRDQRAPAGSSSGRAAASRKSVRASPSEPCRPGRCRYRRPRAAIRRPAFVTRHRPTAIRLMVPSCC
jgi:hypothetical protein